MPFPIPTLDQLILRAYSDIRAVMPNSNPQVDGTPLNVLAKLHAGGLHCAYQAMQKQADNRFVDTCDEDYVYRHADWFGLTPISPVAARGEVVFSGTAGAIILKDTLLQYNGEEEVISYKTTVRSVIQATGTVSVNIIALSPGTDSNLPAGTLLQLTSPITDVQSTVTVGESGITAGADKEGADALRTRLLEYLREPPRGGVSYDYEHWAKEASSDVTRAWCTSSEMGAGTVVVRFVCDNLSSIIPTASHLSIVEQYINSVRPAGQGLLYIVAPELLTIDFSITLLSVDTQAVRDAVTESLSYLITDNADPGAVIPLSHIREAISSATGEYDHTLTSPTENIIAGSNQIPAFGTITWG